VRDAAAVFGIDLTTSITQNPQAAYIMLTLMI